MESFRLEVDATRSVSALLVKPDNPVACFVFAHGAGAGMGHPFMEKVAKALFDRRVATLRYQFPFMEARLRRPDHPTVALATVRVAVDGARRRFPNSVLIAGGKSFGGRMTSRAQAASPLPHVSGLVFFGFPLHAAGKPSTERADHLVEVKIPMLFLQGVKTNSRSRLSSQLSPKGSAPGLRFISSMKPTTHSMYQGDRAARMRM